MCVLISLYDYAYGRGVEKGTESVDRPQILKMIIELVANDI